MLLLGLGYLALGAASLTLAIAPGYASPVFPAAGLALVGVLQLGWWTIPAIGVASFTLNVGHALLGRNLSSDTVLVALVIAGGASIQAAAGGWLVLRRAGSSWRTMEREQDALRFLLLGGAIACLVSPTIGVLGLRLTGVIENAQIPHTWWNWYAGDLLGVLIFAPICLCFVGTVDELWRQRRRRLVLPLLVMLALVAAAHQATARWEARREGERLEDQGQFVARLVEDRLLAQREVLAALRNFIQVTPDLTFAQFEQFTRITLSGNPDISALEFLEIVPGEERERFERRMSERSPLGEFRIRVLDAGGRLVPAPRSSRHVVLTYVVPLAGNEAVVGYDLYSEEVRRSVIDQALASGSVAVTPPIHLIQDRSSRPGMLQMVPVLRNSRPDSVEQPVPVGFAVELIRLDEMIAVATAARVPPDLRFEVTDPAAPEGRRLIHRAGLDPSADAASKVVATWSAPLVVGQRTWVLTVERTEAQRQAARHWAGWALGAMGLLLAAMLQVLLLGITGRAAESERRNEALRWSELRLREAKNAADDALRHLEATLEAIPDLLFELDRDGRFLAIRTPRESLLFVPAEKAQGRTVHEILPPEVAGIAMAAIRGAEISGSDHGRTYRLAMPDGEHWFDLAATRKQGVEGGAPTFVLLCRDITEPTRLREEIQQSQKLESIGRLAGGVAHDFNNLLTVILACAEDMREQSEAGKDVDPENLTDILDAARRATELTRQLLAFARKQVVKPATLDLNTVIREDEKFLRRVIGEDIRIVLDLDPAPWTVKCDRGLLTQVLMNLAVNARDAMTGGGRLTLATQNVTLTPGDDVPESGMSPGEYVRLTVADTGVGMSPEVKAHLFEPFFTTKKVGKGTGLGLATVYGIVKQSGAFIGVRSTVGVGTTFAVYFPREQREVAAPEPPVPARLGGTETILLVEDEPKVREVAARMLRSAGYRVLEADGGERALDLARTEAGPIHLLVTDMVMPGMGGPEVAQRVREVRPGVRVLHMSGYASGFTTRTEAEGAQLVFLPKPFTAETLLAHVREALGAAKPSSASDPVSGA